MKRMTTSAAVLTIALAIAFTSTTPAVAGGDEVIKRGGCSGASVWKLKAKPDNRRLEVEGEVDSNHNGQTWRWRIVHDGVVVRRGSATTSGPSGSFTVERRIVNSPGTDRIGWRAKNPNTGETCRGGLSI